MTFDAFLETAWNDHGDRPQEVADRLASSLHVVEAAEHIPPFARLLTHVYGEHLGQWDRGVALLESLRRVPAFDGSAAAAGALDRNIATLRYAGGETSVLESLSAEDRISVLALAASAFSGRNGMKRAIAAYAEALGSPTPDCRRSRRPFARSPSAATTSRRRSRKRRTATPPRPKACSSPRRAVLTYWKQAGTWLEEERAEYRLTRSLLQAGRPRKRSRAPGGASMSACATTRRRSRRSSATSCWRWRSARTAMPQRSPRPGSRRWRSSSRCPRREAVVPIRPGGTRRLIQRNFRVTAYLSGASSRQPNSRAKSTETRACTAPWQSKKRCVPAHVNTPSCQMSGWM